MIGEDNLPEANLVRNTIKKKIVSKFSQKHATDALMITHTPIRALSMGRNATTVLKLGTLPEYVEANKNRRMLRFRLTLVLMKVLQVLMKCYLQLKHYFLMNALIYIRNVIAYPIQQKLYEKHCYLHRLLYYHNKFAKII